MKTFLKKLAPVVIFGALFIAPHFSLAIDSAYQPLVALPGVTADDSGVGTKAVTMVEYLQGAMKFIVAFAGLLAFVMLVYAGTKYIAAGISPEAKNTAKNNITQALLGLGIVLASYLILNTINPNLVNLKLALTQLGSTSETKIDAAKAVAASPNLTGQPWPFKDDALRTELSLKGITVNKGNCDIIGRGLVKWDTSCTSIGGLQHAVVDHLVELKKDCEAKMKERCAVVITGGTEYWLHGKHQTYMKDNDTFHKPQTKENPDGGQTIDLRLDPGGLIDEEDLALNKYIRTKGKPMEASSECAPGIHYVVLGYMYVDERTGGDRHWHVCYYKKY